MPEGSGEKWDEHSLGQVEGIMDHSLGQVIGIVVSYNSTFIHTLRFLCVKDNIRQISEQHGCSGGNSEMIALDYPTEFLTAVHGYRDGSANLYSSGSSITIKSITFVTNKATYGPFGQQLKGNCGTPFGFKISGNDSRNWISGFYGTVYRGYLECLGVYVHTPTTSQPDESIRQCKSEIQ
nr:inactive protein RESTRICTED TEV MOVEMENT 1-like [Ipomoea batatas]